MKKRLIVDMDGVLSDIYSQYLSYEFKDLKIRQDLNSLNGIPEEEAFINHSIYINSEGFFLTANPIKESVVVLEKLNRNYDVFIVSSATQFPFSLGEKMKWLNQYFPYIHWKQVVLCGSKELISGDIMIDDHFKNLDTFNGKTFLFTQPHNANDLNNGHSRVDNWAEIEKLLL